MVVILKHLVSRLYCLTGLVKVVSRTTRVVVDDWLFNNKRWSSSYPSEKLLNSCFLPCWPSLPSLPKIRKEKILLVRKHKGAVKINKTRLLKQWFLFSPSRPLQHSFEKTFHTGFPVSCCQEPENKMISTQWKQIWGFFKSTHSEF